MIVGVSARDLAQIALFRVILLVTVRPLGVSMARVYAGERTFLTPILGPLERGIYRLCGVAPEAEQRWTVYAVSMLLFNLAGLLLSYLIFRTQQWLPWNDQGFGPVNPDLAFNTAVRFTTNTNWQSYSGESTMSNFAQMVGLAVHNFTSAATGMAIAIALVRGLARRGGPSEPRSIGNFWVDTVRGTLYVLLPISLLLTLVLVWQGVPQTLAGTAAATTIEGADQTLTFGPMASQELIKELGTNGGGFLNANSAHPYEGPTPLASFFQICLIFLIPSALALTFGHMVGDLRQGWAVWGAMATLFIMGRTPQYLGKKLESFDVKMAMLTVLVPPLSILGFTALASVLEVSLAGLNNPGAHGFSEMLYAYTSGTANNGSAFAGLTANTPFYNTTLGLAMLIGRYGMIVPILALAGSLASKRRLPVSLGTFPTTGPLFIGLLVGVVLIVGALTYFPALSLGPIVDQLQLNAGTVAEAAG